VKGNVHECTYNKPENDVYWKVQAWEETEVERLLRKLVGEAENYFEETLAEERVEENCENRVLLLKLIPHCESVTTATEECVKKTKNSGLTTQQTLCHTGDGHLENDNHRDKKKAEKVYISSQSGGLKATKTAFAYVPTERVANASHTAVEVVRFHPTDRPRRPLGRAEV
jgi:hypothetical protein